LLPTTGQAVGITATEVIEDLLVIEDLIPFVPHRDLERTRYDNVSFYEVEHNDATIIAQNNVDGDFGILNNDNVSYTHKLDWLTVLPASFEGACLSITAMGVQGCDDIVFADTWNLGPLLNATTLFGITQTVFSTSNGSALDLILSDGQLQILIDKNANAWIGGGIDQISVFRSELTVCYSTAAVPEPPQKYASVSLGLVALFGFVWRRRLLGGSA
jgi:hypothetical protein